MSEQEQHQNCQKIWIFRVDDGANLHSSNYPFWGIKRGPHNTMKSTVQKKMKKGDIICFLTSKKYGGKIIGMAEYTEFYDREDEPLLSVHTKTNEEQGWKIKKGDGEWDIQIHYRNLYITPEKTKITAIIQCASTILHYDTPLVKQAINRDLYQDYKNFQFYAEPKKFANL